MQNQKSFSQMPDINLRLVEAVFHNDMRAVCRCLDAGADPNARNLDGRPVIFETGHTFHFKDWPWAIWAELVKAGADLNVRDMRGDTILHRAARVDEAQIINVIPFNRLDINARNGLGYTALHEAVEYGSLEAVKALIDAGADPHVETHSGQTPLDLVDYDNILTCHQIEIELNQAIEDLEESE